MKTSKFLSEQGVAFDVLPHRAAFDAQRLADVLNEPGRHVAKTVLLRADHGFAYVVAVLSADRRVNLEAAGTALGGSHLEMASEQEVADHCRDCETGVLPPFGSMYDMKTLIDKRLLEEEFLIFESNSHHEAVRMHVGDFCRLERPRIADFAE